MGTHNYLTEIRRYYNLEEPNLEDIKFRFKDEFAITDVNVFFRDKRYLLLRNDFCREIWITNVSTFLKKQKEQKEVEKCEYLMGIRCFGEMYTDVAKIMDGRKHSDLTLKRFFKRLFGVTLDFEHSTILHDSSECPSGRYLVSCVEDGKPKIKLTDREVSFYIDFRKNPDILYPTTFITAIMALLRESLVISGILKGEIKTLEDLSEKLIEISLKRMNKEDDSYICWTLLSGESVYEFGVLTEYIKNTLSASNSDDGSDGYSILMLAIYLRLYPTMEYNPWNIVNGGPVTQAESFSSKELNKFFKLPFGAETREKLFRIINFYKDSVKPVFWCVWKENEKDFTIP